MLIRNVNNGVLPLPVGIAMVSQRMDGSAQIVPGTWTVQWEMMKLVKRRTLYKTASQGISITLPICLHPGCMQVETVVTI